MSTKIEWADKTWNPITGCTKISEACEHCYAERMSKRLAGRCGYPKGNPFTVTYHQDKIDDPLRWRKPSRIFVCSMGDLFHDAVEEWMLDEIFGVILGSRIFNNTANHTFMILTKRPERMKEYLTSRTPVDLLKAWANSCPWYTQDPDVTVEELVFSATCRDWDENGRNSSGSEHKPWGYLEKIWPLPNVWLGVTAENQVRALERIPILLETPAAKRFVSCEPLLESIDLANLWHVCPECGSWEIYEPRGGTRYCDDCGADVPIPKVGLDWVICGGETGPGARPMHPDWVRSLRDQCKSAEVPFFFKQWGEWTTVYPQGLTSAVRKQTYQYGTSFYGIDKKTAGRSLDGRTWNQYPEVME